MVQQVKELVLFLWQLRFNSWLQLRFGPCPRNFHMPQAGKRKEEKKKNQTWLRGHSCLCRLTQRVTSQPPRVLKPPP